MFLKNFLTPKVFHRNIDPSKYRLEIDGLRFFAIMVVMIGHLLERVDRFWLTPNPELDFAPASALMHFFASPNQGVLLFFAISGFIIAKQMQDVAPGRFDATFVGKYYIRRITRIFPPYYLILLVTFVAYFFFGLMPSGLNRSSEADISLPASLAASLFYIHGAMFDSMPKLFALGWSLEVEVQFYLLAPLIFLMLFRGEDRSAPWRFALMLALFFAISFVAINRLIPVNAFTILSYIVYFGVGITLARHENAFQRAFSRIGSRASMVLGTACVVGMFWLGNARFEPLPMTLIYWLCSLGTIIVLFGLAFQPGTMFGRFCRLPYVTYIGMACYSLYLVHMQLFHIAAIVFGKFVPITYFTVAGGFTFIMLGGIAAGLIFFAFVEKPFAAWRPFSARPKVQQTA